jgi:2-polyprenyl-3-methyl-5-hydroxy-6-metoxy-1,4-benzoquinol methylase
MEEQATDVLRMRRTYVDPEKDPWGHLGVLLCPQVNLYKMLAAEDKIHGTVLEVGFGAGAQVVQFADKANWVDATEIDPKAVAFAKTWWPFRNVNWMVGDICRKDAEHPGAEYDVIMCFEVLEHTEDPEAALSNMAKMLKRGGTAYLSVPHNDAGSGDLHKWTWTPDDFKSDLETFFDHASVSTHGRLMFAMAGYA